MKRVFIIFFAFTLSFAFLSYPETITLKSGKTIEARIIERTDSYIKVDIKGIPITYYLDEIEAIEGVKTSTPQTTLTALTTKDPKEIFEQVSPAIVYITTKTLTAEEYLGSGFIVDKNGIIVTNLHVLQGAQEVSVRLKDGTVYPVTGFTYYDAQRDLCIFKINATNLPTIPLGDSKALKVGEKLYCIGNPLGLKYSFSDGLLSGIRDLNNIKYLQFTAPISPGNSGGPLINPQGEAIGMVTFLMEKGQNLNFGLAINEIKPYLNNPIKPFSEFVEKVSEADYYLVEGLKQFSQGDYSQAINYFKKLLQINPNFASAYNNLGATYVDLGQYQKAKENLQKAKELFQKQGNYQGVQAVDEHLKKLP
jgi:S1-C subfamily serine protease